MIMMHGTSTHGEHTTTYSSAVRPGCDHNGWALGMMCLWKNWSIQLFVLLSLIFQIVLAVLGSRRKILRAKTIRFVIWASYPLASYVSTLALGKLTSVSLKKSEEEYDTELKALLAPLTLLLMGNPDSITAYSVEDNWIGLRRVLNLVVTFPFMVWILVRSWKTSIRMILYFPMFVAGIIEHGVTIWALYSAYNESMKMTAVDHYSAYDKSMKMIAMDPNEEEDTFAELMRSPVNHKMKIFFVAFKRFNSLRPHLLGWLKHPFFMLDLRFPIDKYSPAEVFLTTDMELGFMYDVLYTKAPVLYTKPGITLRAISYFSLLLTLGGFMGLFFDKLLRDPYVIYTFGLLIGVELRETYQLWKLFDSDWMIIMCRNHLHIPLVSKLARFVAKRTLKKKRWSNTIQQFNFIDFCQSDKRPWFFTILKFFGMGEKFRKHRTPNPVIIPDCLKTILLEDMKKFETMRCHQPFTKRGEWSLGIASLDKLNWSIEMAFDRSIIIWHVATHVCYHSCHEKSSHKDASKLMSDYMMFLLVQHPSILLSLTTTDFTFSHAYTRFMKFLYEKQHSKENVLKALSGSEPVQEGDYERSPETVITKGWNVLEEARKLATELENTRDKWEVISSVWVEMLCFAAYNCQQYHHAKLLRQGGDIITHVWLLLSHKTDKFNTMKYIEKGIKIEEG
ncbi:hypothetical protein BT93_L1873 [Corymbia citriodora subsp. variegata]|uniref:DUF4220 domain-containing protein n=1 Tax=Corymbia citriodora subsp. variegata TaxID=360336 RepID=A0A8T0CLC5_CORYI|nr:hypothetical protein BT93_L1873 [Corymbia citriodora subsp. variegata]